jgi:hypothetical protein
VPPVHQGGGARSLQLQHRISASGFKESIPNRTVPLLRRDQRLAHQVSDKIDHGIGLDVITPAHGFECFQGAAADNTAIRSKSTCSAGRSSPMPEGPNTAERFLSQVIPETTAAVRTRYWRRNLVALDSGVSAAMFWDGVDAAWYSTSSTSRL